MSASMGDDSTITALTITAPTAPIPMTPTTADGDSVSHGETGAAAARAHRTRHTGEQ